MATACETLAGRAGGHAACAGLVYEAAGSVDAALLPTGAELVRRAAATHTMPVALIDAGPDHDDWPAAANAAVDHVLAG